MKKMISAVLLICLAALPAMTAGAQDNKIERLEAQLAAAAGPEGDKAKIIEIQARLISAWAERAMEAEKRLAERYAARKHGPYYYTDEEWKLEKHRAVITVETAIIAVVGTWLLTKKPERGILSFKRPPGK